MGIDICIEPVSFLVFWTCPYLNMRPQKRTASCKPMYASTLRWYWWDRPEDRVSAKRTWCLKTGLLLVCYRTKKQTPCCNRFTKYWLCYRTGRPSVRPQQVRDGLPQHRVPRVRGRGGAVPGDGGGTRHPGPAASAPHESPAVFLCAARAGRQAESLVPRILRHSYTSTLQVCSCLYQHPLPFWHCWNLSDEQLL